MSQPFDVVCVGGGIVGLATALKLARGCRGRFAVIEAESEPALHQSGRNSGVIHSGLYYKPGSAKARACVDGRRQLIDLCEAENLAHEICGKLVIATRPDEIERLTELERRGTSNGLQGLLRVPGPAIPEYEPHALGIDALWVPQTGIVDYKLVTRTYARLFAERGGELRFGTRLEAIEASAEVLVLETSSGPIETRHLINCAGLHSDRVARMAGVNLTVRIVGFRGEYFDLREDRRHLLRNLIYPVPDPRFPFLGVHLTRRIDGSVEAGPNAVLALHREGYQSPRIDRADALDALLYPGLWRLAARTWHVGLSEYLRSGSPRRFARAVREFVPDFSARDLTSGGCGIRAQALAADGTMLDDFEIERSQRALHVLNAPSPAATAALAIGDQLCAMAQKDFGLEAFAHP